MSEYFRVLNRLAEQGAMRSRTGAPQEPFHPVSAPQSRELNRPVAPPADIEPEAVTVELREAQPAPSVAAPAATLEAPASLVASAPLRAVPSALQELIDAVQRIRLTGETKSLVMTSASGHENTADLATKVVRVMRERGLPINAVRISDGSRFRASQEIGELALTGQSGAWAGQLAEWRASLAGDSVGLVIAPSLAVSSDAALLGNACDGVVVLVELGRTTRHALAQAVKRIEGASANLLGLIVVGSEGLPSWARKFRRAFQ